MRIQRQFRCGQVSCLRLIAVVLLLPAWALPDAEAHPLSFTDAWVRVTDRTVEVRLNVFLDDILLHQDRLPEEQNTVSAALMNDAIRKHTAFLLNQLQIFDAGGNHLSGVVLSVPRSPFGEKDVDPERDASVKLTWNLRYEPSPEAVSEFSLLTFLHGYTHSKLQQPGELRLHLLDVATGRRSDVTIPVHRPHTIVLKSTNVGRTYSSAEPNRLTSRIVVSPMGLTHEISAPLLLMDSAWPTASKLRESLSVPPISGKDTVAAGQIDVKALREAVSVWARSQVMLKVNGHPVEDRHCMVELLDGQCEPVTLSESSGLVNVPLPGTLVGVRLRYPGQRDVRSVEVTFGMLPGPFDELQTELVSRTGQVSEVRPAAMDGALVHSFVWDSVFQDLPEPKASLTSRTVLGVSADDSPILVHYRYPGVRWAWLSLVIASAALCWSGVRNLRARGRRAIQYSLLTVALVIPWVLPDEMLQVDVNQASVLTTRLLADVYDVAMEGRDEVSAILSLSRVLSDDLAELVYVETVAMLAGDPESDLLVEIQSVDMVSVLPHTEHLKRDRLVSECVWQLRGVVNHWGHAHDRTLRFVGNISLQQHDGGWKISELTPTDVKIQADVSGQISRLDVPEER